MIPLLSFLLSLFLQALKGSVDELRGHFSDLDSKTDGLSSRVDALEISSKVGSLVLAFVLLC